MRSMVVSRVAEENSVRKKKLVWGFFRVLYSDKFFCPAKQFLIRLSGEMKKINFGA